MAKYTPTLLGQDTDVNIGAFFQGGFVDAGADQLNQAIQNNVKVVTEAKNKKFEQAQSLRDGIVSGHFSDDMAGEIGGYIEQLTDMPTYSKAYASTLASANAKLGIMVAKQAKITTEMERTTTDFDADPSSKYYDPNLSARLHDQINGDEENGIVGTGIDTSSANIQDALSSFKNDKTNIKDGVVRTDFQSKLGEIVQKIEKTGGLGNVNSEFASFTTTTGGQKFVTGYTYDAKNRMYVPAFDKTKLPPKGIVELYRGIDDAAATLMDDYVNEKHKANNTDPSKPIDPHAKSVYEQEFVLEEMKKLTPGGAIDEKNDKEFRNRPQDPNTGSGAQLDLQMQANTVNDMVTNIDQIRNLDLSQLPGGSESVPFAKVDVNGDGNLTQMLDVTGFSKADYQLARIETKNLLTGAPSEDYVRPSKVYLSIDPDSAERTLYFEGMNSEGDAQYTVYNDQTANQMVQNMTKKTFGSQKYFDSWSLVNKQKGVMSGDGSNNKQIKLTGVTKKGQAAAIVKQKQAEDQAQEAGAFDAAELQTSIYNADNDNKAIDAALLPVNNFFAKTGHESKGLVDKDNKKVTERKVKYVKFDRDGNYAGRRFSKKYGVLSYRAMQDDGSYGPVQTANMKVSALISEISGGQGEFNLNQEK
jgi:hypothetical protein